MVSVLQPVVFLTIDRTVIHLNYFGQESSFVHAQIYIKFGRMGYIQTVHTTTSHFAGEGDCAFSTSISLGMKCYASTQPSGYSASCWMLP